MTSKVLKSGTIDCVAEKDGKQLWMILWQDNVAEVVEMSEKEGKSVFVCPVEQLTRHLAEREQKRKQMQDYKE